MSCQLLPVTRSLASRRLPFSLIGSASPTSSSCSFPRLITCRYMSFSSESTVPTVSTVTISYSELKENNIDLSGRIEEGFGPNGLGILSVKDVPGYSVLRQNLLRLAPRLAGLPEEVKRELEDAYSTILVGVMARRNLNQGSLVRAYKDCFIAAALVQN